MKGKRIRIRPLRVAGYLVMCLALGFLYYFLQSYYISVIGVALLCLPVLSVLMAWELCKYVKVGMTAAGGEPDGEQAKAVQGEELWLELVLDNPSWCCCLDGRMLLDTKNLFFGDVERLEVSMAARPRGKSVFRRQLPTEALGGYRVGVSDLWFQDLMGFVYIALPAAQKGREVTYFVAPERGEADEDKLLSYAAGAAEAEESRVKGSDFAEVSDIREYVPGDRPRDIYWKLSARLDMLMVKERTAMSGTELYVVSDLSGEREDAERVLQYTYTLCHGLFAQRIPARLLFWSAALYGFEEFVCCDAADLDGAYGRIFMTPVSQRHGEGIAGHMRNLYPYLAGYVLVEAEGGEIKAELVENG